MKLAYRAGNVDDEGYIVTRLARASGVSRALASAVLSVSRPFVAHDVDSGALVGFHLCRNGSRIYTYVTDELRMQGIGTRLRRIGDEAQGDRSGEASAAQGSAGGLRGQHHQPSGH